MADVAQLNPSLQTTRMGAREQVRSAVADGTLRVSESQAIRLASYCVQEQYGEIIDNDGEGPLL